MKPPGGTEEQRLSSCIVSHVDTIAAKWPVSRRGSYNLAKYIVPKTLILLIPSNEVTLGAKDHIFTTMRSSW